MIRIGITEHGIRMEGHAGHHKDGQDLVCAAVSALTCNLINGLQELAGVRIRAETESGRAAVEWECLTEKGRLLVDAWFLGIAAVNQNYHCIEYV